MTGTMMKPPPTPMMAASTPTKTPSNRGIRMESSMPDFSNRICQGRHLTNRVYQPESFCRWAYRCRCRVPLNPWRLSMNM